MGLLDRMTMTFRDEAIPFYGANDRGLFDIERRAMDRDGAITRYLDSMLPQGSVLDIGAGDGFVAESLSGDGRRVVALEPASGMLEPRRKLLWVRGIAQRLPFKRHAFEAAYGTFAYFFPSIGCGTEGLVEVERVLKPGSSFHFVDSAGDDEFCALANPGDVNRGADISSPRQWWHEYGFASTVIRTSFRFETLADAQRLLGFFFGDVGRSEARLEVGFNAVVYSQETPFSGGGSPPAP